MAEKKIEQKYAKGVAYLCMKDSCLEYLPKGSVPASNSGKFDDVKIVDANGKEHKWNETARITKEEYDNLLQNIVNAVYEFLSNVDEDDYHDRLKSAANLFENVKNTESLKNPLSKKIN